MRRGRCGEIGDDGLAQGDKPSQQRNAADAQPQTDGGGVEQVAVGVVAVAGDLAGQVGVQPEVGDDFEPEEGVDDVVIIARISRPQDAQHQRGEGEFHDAIEEGQQDRSDAVLRQPLDCGAVVFVAVDQTPHPDDGEEDEAHPGDEGDERAVLDAVGAVFEAHCGALVQPDATEVPRDAHDGHFVFLVLLRVRRADEGFPAGEVGVGEDEPRRRVDGGVDDDFVRPVAGDRLCLGRRRERFG